MLYTRDRVTVMILSVDISVKENCRRLIVMVLTFQSWVHAMEKLVLRHTLHCVSECGYDKSKVVCSAYNVNVYYTIVPRL